MKKTKLCAFAVVAMFATTCLGAKPADTTSTMVDADSINIVYDPDSGNLALDIGDNLTPDPFLTSFQIESAAGLLEGPFPDGFTMGFFDVYEPTKSFHLDVTGFHDFASFGNVGTGRTGPELLADFTVDGSMLPMGDIDSVNVNIVGPAIPEPTSLALVLIGALGLIARARK